MEVWAKRVTKAPMSKENAEGNKGYDCPTCGDSFESAVSVKAHHQHHSKPYWDAVIEKKYNKHPADVVAEFYKQKQLSLKETANEIGCSTQAIIRIAKDYDLETRSKSEGMNVRWENAGKQEREAMLSNAHEKTRRLAENGEHNFSNWAEDTDLEERKERTKAAREKHFNKYGDSGYIKKWVDENPEKHQELVESISHLGTQFREENGMAGVTGQDHPRWRGGKSIYDAVKKQLPGRSWRQLKVEAKKKDGYYCQNCGAIGVKLDSHHIVPIMSGGTNEEWNLITLCESCHRKTEAFIKQYPEFDPVLVD